MFLPVACSHCSKPFQVADAVIGQSTVCPWCQATVLALPVAASAIALTPRPAPELLSLDDAPSAAHVRRFSWRLMLVGVVALVFTTAMTVSVLRYKQGHLISTEWRGFTAPDGSCAIDLLGRPTETGQDNEKWHVSEGWYSGTTAWVGWRDLTPLQVQMAGTKDAWQQFRPTFDAEIARLKETHGGSVTKDATAQFEDPLTHEVRLSTPKGLLIERMIVMPSGQRPRIYFIGMAGKIDPDGPEAQRLFDSFRVLE